VLEVLAIGKATETPDDRKNLKQPTPEGRTDETTKRCAVAAGALLGAAVAVKLYPVLLLAAVLRCRTVVVATAAGVVALSYLPHVAAVGPDVLGFLPEYLSVEGYQDGHRFQLLGLVGLSGTSAKAVAAAGLAAVAVAVAVAGWRAGPDRVGPERAAIYLLGAAFLLATPAQPWYGIPLVALAVLAGRLEWMAVAAAPYVLYMALLADLPVADAVARPGGYAVAAAVVAVTGLTRLAVGRRRRSSGTRPPAARERNDRAAFGIHVKLSG
jgi:hypothetical protein